MPRQKLTRPPASAAIPPPQAKAARDRSWERQQRSGDLVQVSYRRIPRLLRDQLTALARQKLCPVDDIARAFLEYALEAYQEGRLQFDPRLRSGKYTLFPEDE